jgi:hypothetical protein
MRCHGHREAGRRHPRFRNGCDQAGEDDLGGALNHIPPRLPAIEQYRRARARLRIGE